MTATCGYDQSRSGGEAEALTVVQRFETAEFMPAGARDRLSGEIVCYGRSVVHREWPQMEQGRGGDAINPWAIALTLLAISALDSPYRSRPGQIKPVAMERSLRILDRAREVVDDTAPPPCDARGVRVAA